MNNMNANMNKAFIRVEIELIVLNFLLSITGGQSM
jgi:hypothetical protein